MIKVLLEIPDEFIDDFNNVSVCFILTKGMSNI